MHSGIIKDTTDSLMNHYGPVDWNELVERWQKKEPGIDHFPAVSNRATMDEVIRRLDDTIQYAARLRGYLDARYGHGCGDQGHASGVKQGNKLVKAVRKALGFTYPGKDLGF